MYNSQGVLFCISEASKLQSLYIYIYSYIHIYIYIYACQAQTSGELPKRLD